MEHLIDIQIRFKDSPDGSPHCLSASVDDGEDRRRKILRAFDAEMDALTKKYPQFTEELQNNKKLVREHTMSKILLPPECRPLFENLHYGVLMFHINEFLDEIEKWPNSSGPYNFQFRYTSPIREFFELFDKVLNEKHVSFEEFSNCISDKLYIIYQFIKERKEVLDKQRWLLGFDLDNETWDKVEQIRDNCDRIGVLEASAYLRDAKGDVEKAIKEFHTP